MSEVDASSVSKESVELRAVSVVVQRPLRINPLLRQSGGKNLSGRGSIACPFGQDLSTCLTSDWLMPKELVHEPRFGHRAVSVGRIPLK